MLHYWRSTAPLLVLLSLFFSVSTQATPSTSIARYVYESAANNYRLSLPEQVWPAAVRYQTKTKWGPAQTTGQRFQTQTFALNMEVVIYPQESPLEGARLFAAERKHLVQTPEWQLEGWEPIPSASGQGLFLMVRNKESGKKMAKALFCLLYTSPSPRDA